MEISSSRHLVIGHKGEVGSALFEVLKGNYEVEGVDKEGLALLATERPFDVLHIAIGYSDKFITIVEEYMKTYLAAHGMMVVHSTVPLGTTRRLGMHAVHSPIRGVHPNLAEGIKTFVKYFGGSRASEAAEVFARLGIATKTTDVPENTEALKLWDTAYYGWNIILNKAMKAYCDEHGLDFNIVYTDANKTYNEGYAALGKSEVARPVLEYRQGEIGGHCVIPNCKLLGGDIVETILAMNEKYRVAVEWARTEAKSSF